LRAKGAKYLATRLLDEIDELNWTVRDQLTDWSLALESSGVAPDAYHLAQVFDLKKHLDLSLTKFRGIDSMFKKLVALERNDAAAEFFQDEMIYFKHASGNVARLVDSVMLLQKSVTDTITLFHTRQQFQHTNLLYLLTFVLVLQAPAQFVSAFYSMNITSLPGLDFEWSYPVLWGAIVFGMIMVLLQFHRRNYFRSV